MIEKTDEYGRWESEDGVMWLLVEPTTAATEAAEQRALEEPTVEETTPATVADLQAATAPADSTQAERVRNALNDLATKQNQVRALHAQYNASDTSQKQTIILDRFDDLLEGLADVLDILEGTIRAAVKDRA